MVKTLKKYKFVRTKREAPETVCAAGQSQEECETALLRAAVVEIKDDIVLKTTNLEEIRALTAIVEDFLGNNRLLCYGGQAINNILPRHKRFYSSVTIPDYDFYSTNAMQDAIKLADLYFKLGYTEVYAKAGVHHGTYNVFVNYNKYADITQLDASVFGNLWAESIVVNKIHYAPPNWLRMAIYLELCRPQGDISRWEKILPRLNLLNKYYPLKLKNSARCAVLGKETRSTGKKSKKDPDGAMQTVIFSSLLNENVIFFGGYAMQYYAEYVGRETGKGKNAGATNLSPGLVKDFHVLSPNAEKTAKVLQEELRQNGYKNVSFAMKEAVGEIMPKRVVFKVNGSVLGYIYQPDECVSYNTIEVYQDFWIHGELIEDRNSVVTMNIASIDTILRFYFALLYTSSTKNNLTPEVILCACDALMKLQKSYLFTQKGILKRFSLTCVGPQATLIDILRNKTQKRKEFKGRKNQKSSSEFNRWFLNYTPGASNRATDLKTVSRRRSKTDKEVPF